MIGMDELSEGTELEPSPLCEETKGVDVTVDPLIPGLRKHCRKMFPGPRKTVLSLI